MKHYAMVIDTKRCIGCSDCVVACKTENKVPEGFARDWIVEEVTGSFPNLSLEYRTERCNHCIDPPCVTVCPTGASHILEDTNITLVTEEKCTGCKACVAACPYDARFVMPEGFVSKCTFCAHRLEKNELPACVSVCPTHCMYFGDLNDPNSEVSLLLKTRKYKTLIPEAGTKPSIYYLTD
ncbi:MAG: 4Fe-4S dicluster domain-containing protein [Bdellovibrionales bacterium]|nr:4Fe-4S dicluster domain-containing protein [Bdellovibrionales bacterium]